MAADRSSTLRDDAMVGKGEKAGIVMGTIMIEHKMGGMLDHDLIEENL